MFFCPSSDAVEAKMVQRVEQAGEWLLLTRVVGEPPEFDKEVKNIGRHLPTQLQVAGKFGARIKGNE